MPSSYISKKIKKVVIARSDGRCEYCKSLQKYSPQPFVIEHIIPKSLGGPSLKSNLAFSCGGCNGHKYDKVVALDPVTGEETPLFHPRKHIWSVHFHWDNLYLKIIGMTPIGRTTVRALHLNRIELVNLREITILIGEHPPVGF